jgi:metallo-beta-lactamase class B
LIFDFCLLIFDLSFLAYNPKMPRCLLCLLYLLSLSSLLLAQSDWNDPFPPHRIADSLYYVGSKGLSSYLITTPQGHILINSSFDRTVPLIRASVEKLGFKFSDVKILLTSHAHSDHVEGNALVKELTGARVYVMAGDDQVVANGGKGQYLYTSPWKPCKVDRVLHDGDQVKLGEAVLTAHLTPGHTRGCTTWTMQAKDGGKVYDVVIVGSPNVNPGYQLVNNSQYPEIADDFARTFRVLKALHCDIFLGAHGSYYGMEAKYTHLQAAKGTNPFVDPEGYRAYVAEREEAYRKTLAQQRK